ncbi:MAG: flagellar basal body-associated FliL family protein [Paracoccaceae bacterium]|nr:flagellar basal body-associated FliL family protein [Paracoccaceae bacterium]
MTNSMIVLTLVLAGWSSTLFAQEAKVSPKPEDKTASARIAANRDARDPTKLADIKTLLRGVMAFECELGSKVFPMILLENNEDWTMPSASDLIITEINDGFAFTQENDPLYLGFLKEEKDAWKLTELDDSGMTKGRCTGRGELLADATEIIAPKILKNALHLNDQLTAAETRVAALEDQLATTSNAICETAETTQSSPAPKGKCPPTAPSPAIQQLQPTSISTKFFEFPAILTGNLKGGAKILDIGIGFLIQDNGPISSNIETNLAILSEEIIATLNTYTEEEITGRDARYALAEDLQVTMNAALTAQTGLGGIDKVHFTYFAVD